MKINGAHPRTVTVSSKKAASPDSALAPAEIMAPPAPAAAPPTITATPAAWDSALMPADAIMARGSLFIVAAAEGMLLRGARVL